MAYSFYSMYMGSIKKMSFLTKITGGHCQGSCGIMEVEMTDNNEVADARDCRDLVSSEPSNRVFYKHGLPDNNMTLARMEYIVSQQLMRTCFHLPNFLRSLLYTKNQTLSKKRRGHFDTKPHRNCWFSDLILFEYLQGSVSFSTFSKRATTQSITDAALQVMLAVICAQQRASFNHNDLHAANIMMVKCNPRIKYLYRLEIEGEEKLYVVPSGGQLPIIIDYGYSYSSDCDGFSLENADVDNFGFITYKHDSLSDFIRFLVVLHHTPIREEFAAFIFELLRGLPISLKSSWENQHKTSSMRPIERDFSASYKRIIRDCKSSFIQELFRLMTRMIVLPIASDDCFEAYNERDCRHSFLEEWMHIEKWLNNDNHKYYIMRTLCDSIRKRYSLVDHTHLVGQDSVARDVKQALVQIELECVPLQLDWNRLILSFIRYMGIVRNRLYTNITSLERDRHNTLYTRLVSGEHVFSMIEKHVVTRDRLSLEEGDEVILIDNIECMNVKKAIDTTGEYTALDLYKLMLA